MEKNRLRQQMLQKRLAMSVAEKKKADQRVLSVFRTFLSARDFECVALYDAIKGEVETRDFDGELFSKKRRVCLPKMNGDRLGFVEIKNRDSMKRHPWGFLEPQNDSWCSLSEIDAVFLPGLAFDRRGHRLGYGQGCYDKSLKAYGGLKVGLAYAFQIVDCLSPDDWDVPCHFLLSERGVMEMEKENEHAPVFPG